MKHAVEKKSNEDTSIEINHQVQETYRLNKFISDSGYASRRASDRLVEDGKVSVDGVQAIVGMKITKDQEVVVEGHVLSRETKRVYIMLNKPTGITCTTDLDIEGNISEFMNYPSIIFPIGRLDKDSSGMILLTNDGDVVNKILREENNHDKEYIVTVEKPITDSELRRMAQGVKILNAAKKEYQVTRPCEIKRISPNSYSIVLHQGLNRQIRRMATAVTHHVIKLERIRMMHLKLDLKPGEWRYLTTLEMKELNEIL